VSADEPEKPAEPKAAAAEAKAAEAKATEPKATEAKPAEQIPRPPVLPAASAAPAPPVERRRRTRASTFLELPPGAFKRHDIIVVLAALVLIAVGGLSYRYMTTAPTVHDGMFGLEFVRTTSWLAPETVGPRPSRLAAGVADRPPPPEIPPDLIGEQFPYHVLYTSSLNALVRLEVQIAPRPRYSNMQAALAFARRDRYGELYWAAPSKIQTINGHDWLRTAFRYAYKLSRDDAPRMSQGVEYAAINGDLLYAITMHGSDAEIDQLEEVIAGSLQVTPRPGVSPMPFGPRNPTPPTQVEHLAGLFPSTAMVIAVDLVGGELRPVAGASAIILSPDGSVLTNFHVIQETEDHLHDLFLIALYQGVSRAPEIICAGHPSWSKFDREADLALLKCDMDLDGRPWNLDTMGEPWPPMPAVHGDTVVPGEKLWVVGYPDEGGGGIMVSQGLIEGFDGWSTGGDTGYIKTNAPITHGNSGGPVFDSDGLLIGVATAFRVRASIGSGSMVAGRVGLVRPIAAAASLIGTAQAGWTPRLGANEVTPYGSLPSGDALPPPPEDGIRVTSRIVDVANDQPIVGALVVVFKPAITSRDIDLNRLDQQALAWALTNGEGEFFVKPAVPRNQSYTVAVLAKGFHTLVSDDAMVLGDATPTFYDPWGIIRLERQ
jgi:hypothetical protein